MLNTSIENATVQMTNNDSQLTDNLVHNTTFLFKDLELPTELNLMICFLLNRESLKNFIIAINIRDKKLSVASDINNNQKIIIKNNCYYYEINILKNAFEHLFGKNFCNEWAIINHKVQYHHHLSVDKILDGMNFILLNPQYMKNRSRGLTLNLNLIKEMGMEKCSLIGLYLKSNTLFLSGKFFTQIPFAIKSDLRVIGKKITILNLSKNSLRDLPLEFKCLDRLEELNLSDNLLTKVPAVVCYKYFNLKKLDLSKNCLKELPSSLTEFKELNELRVELNLLKNINPDVASFSEQKYKTWCEVNSVKQTAYWSWDMLKNQRNSISEIEDEHLNPKRNVVSIQ